MMGLKEIWERVREGWYRLNPQKKSAILGFIIGYLLPLWVYSLNANIVDTIFDFIIGDIALINFSRTFKWYRNILIPGFFTDLRFISLNFVSAVLMLGVGYFRWGRMRIKNPKKFWRTVISDFFIITLILFFIERNIGLIGEIWLRYYV